MNAISGVGAANSTWPETRSARAADGVFSLTDSNVSDSVEDVMQTPDTGDDAGPNASELDEGLRDLMPPPASTLEFARQYGENDLSEPSSSIDHGNGHDSGYVGASAGETSNDGSSTSDVDQALNTLVDLVMQQYGQRDASSSDDASGGSLSVSA
jgi:hypothetical protein